MRKGAEMDRVVDVIGVGLLFLGLLVASVLGNSDIVYRSAVSLLPMMLAVGVFALRFWRSGEGVSVGFLVLLLAFGYFAVRALVSEVGILGDRDFLLFFGGVVVAALMQSGEVRRLVVRCLPYFALLMLVVHSFPLLWQWEDRTYVPLRPDLATREQLSGFFGHRNFFGLLVGMAGLVCLAFLVFGRGGWVYRVCLGLGGAWGLALVYLSESRGALVAVVMGCVALALCWILLQLVADTRRAKGALAAGVLLLAGMGFGGHYLFGNVLANRETEGDFFFLNARQDMLMMVADAEPESWVVGGGSRFFQYECRRIWDVERQNNSLGDPRVVHNEFAEALVNYGYVGAGGFLVLLVLGFSWFFRQMVAEGMRLKGKRHGSVRSDGLAVRCVTGVALVVICVQCLVDFTLHVLPLMMVFGGCLGYLLSFGKKWVLPRVLVPLLMVSSVLVASWVCFPYWVSFFDHERLLAYKVSSVRERVAVADTVGRRTGDFELLLHAGELEYGKAVTEEGGAEERLARAFELYEQAHVLNPGYGRAALMCGRVKMELGEYGEAGRFLEHALVWLGNMEWRFGVRFEMGVLEYREFQEWLVTAGEETGEKEKIRRLRDCLGWLESSRGRGFRWAKWQQDLWHEMYGNYYLWNALVQADSGREMALEGRNVESVTRLEFTESLYKRGRRMLKWGEGEFGEYEERFGRVRRQIEFFEENGVEVDLGLFERFEAEVKVVPRE